MTTLMMSTIKLKNRRVSMGRLDVDGSYAMVFRNLDPHAKKGQRVRNTKLRLSAEAMDALINLYFNSRGSL